MTLRLTHLSRRRESCPWDLDGDGWFIRFTGDGDEWSELKEDLKGWGRERARWIPGYEWDDEKKGSWWILDDLFREVYAGEFGNLRQSMLDATDEEVQWVYKYRRGWEGSRPYRYQTHRESWGDWEQEQQQKQEPQIPVYLQSDYSLLEIGGNATCKEVKDAYRMLAKKCHPDAGGTHLAFIALQAAYERVYQWAELRERIAG